MVEFCGGGVFPSHMFSRSVTVFCRFYFLVGTLSSELSGGVGLEKAA